jgi:hypothetical protein
MTRRTRLLAVIRSATVVIGAIGTIWWLLVLFGASDARTVPTVLIFATVLGALVTAFAYGNRGS